VGELGEGGGGGFGGCVGRTGSGSLESTLRGANTPLQGENNVSYSQKMKYLRGLGYEQTNKPKV
jgi:hypothetical protein